MNLQKAFEDYMKKIELEDKAQQRVWAAKERTHKAKEKLKDANQIVLEYNGKKYFVEWELNRPWPEKLVVKEIADGH